MVGPGLCAHLPCCARSRAKPSRLDQCSDAGCSKQLSELGAPKKNSSARVGPGMRQLHAWPPHSVHDWLAFLGMGA